MVLDGVKLFSSYLELFLIISNYVIVFNCFYLYFLLTDGIDRFIAGITGLINAIIRWVMPLINRVMP
jgi:hypothetical protein